MSDRPKIHWGNRPPIPPAQSAPTSVVPTPGTNFYKTAQEQRRQEPTVAESMRPHLQRMKSQLSGMDGFWAKRQAREDIRQAYKQALVTMFQMQKEELVFRMTVHLSDAKKRILMESLAESGRIDQQIFAASTQFEMQIIDEFLLFMMKTYDGKANWIATIDQWAAAGRMSPGDYQDAMRRVHEVSFNVLENLSSKKDIFLQNHAAKIQHALELFQQRDGGTL
jgi:hypothetical protein